MRQCSSGKNHLLLHNDGTIHYPFSKFLTDKFSNPHTRELVAQSLRIFYRLSNAHKIELTLRAIEGRSLTYDEAKNLAALCYRPLPEIEAMSDRKVVSLSSAKSGKAPKELHKAVEHNTADKRLNHIAQFLKHYCDVHLLPRTPLYAREQLIYEYDKTCHQLKTTINGTKQNHHHDIKSLPSDKFMAIIEAIYLRPEELFLSNLGKVSRNLMRDRAMALLCCESLRPGTLGNIARANFRESSGHLVITDNRSKRTERITTGTPKLKLGDSTLVNSASETMIQLWPFTIKAIREYIDGERKEVLMKRLKNNSNGFLFLNEKGEPIKHRASITGIFNGLGKQLAKQGLLDVGNDPYFADQKKYDFYGYVLRHSAASYFMAEKGTDENAKSKMKVRFGWTTESKQPERYAARALSDQANLDMMEFNQRLLDAAHAMKQ